MSVFRLPLRGGSGLAGNDDNSATRFMTDCAACRLAGGPFSLAEAEVHAGTHDDLVHGGRPVTEVRPVGAVPGPAQGCAA